MIGNIGASYPNCLKRDSRINISGSGSLKEILDETQYRITESNTGLYGDIYRCFSCDLYFVNRSGAEDSLAAYYSRQSLDGVYVSDAVGRRKAFRKVLGKISNLSHGIKSLLDVGCGPGFFLSEAKESGLDVWGLEISGASVRFAKEKLHLKNIFESDKSLEASAPDKFDVVTAFDYMEHAIDPKDIFIKAEKNLKSGGLLVFTVPVIDSLAARFLGKKWHALVPSHLNYFTMKSLEGIYQPLGYSLILNKWHWKYLSAAYLLRRLFKKPDLWFPKMLDFVVPINFFDEAEVYLRKNR